jgi:hypothetical protein
MMVTRCRNGTLQVLHEPGERERVAGAADDPDRADASGAVGATSCSEMAGILQRARDLVEHVRPRVPPRVDLLQHLQPGPHLGDLALEGVVQDPQLGEPRGVALGSIDVRFELPQLTGGAEVQPGERGQTDHPDADQPGPRSIQRPGLAGGWR